MVSNLQLNPGIYATAATAVLALVNNNTDIVADFREKSLRHTAVNTDAAVVFDALPGQVFPAHVTSSDAGILAGQGGGERPAVAAGAVHPLGARRPADAHSRRAGSAAGQTAADRRPRYGAAVQ